MQKRLDEGAEDADHELRDLKKLKVSSHSRILANKVLVALGIGQSLSNDRNCCCLQP